ncbi:cell division protein FtsL [Streptomyces sp. NA04227]|uniref:cell division protein FtsL n=1 Tax=Streptomyces sp. NA04227 TaxID=2742136 RepID=UPI0015904CE1|nr:cell division protein FtsL [Streptomyces sp. NA04227]QKW05998.1 cell division protein FtsL [Streptomyces sp. NA04227]
MSKSPELKGRAARLARLFPTGPSGAARTPFVLLVVVLLGGGLIVLLMLNSSLNAGSFELSELKKDTTSLTEERQELERDVDGYAAPGALQRRARELGMVPGGDPVFLAPDGTLRGVPGVAQKPASAPARPRSTPRPSASASSDAPADTAPTAQGSRSDAPFATPATPRSSHPAPSTSGR